MGSKIVNRTACAFVVALAAAAPPAQSGVGVLTELIARTYCADADGTPHPRQLEFIQPITDALFAQSANPYLLAGYGIETAPGRARVKGLTVEATLVKPDGSEKQLGRLRSKVTRNGQAEVLMPVVEKLEKGDLIEWRIQFRGSPKLVDGECFLALVGHADVPDLNGLRAFTGFTRLDG